MATFTMGLDLGQSRDPSVLAVVEHVERRTGRVVERITGDAYHETELEHYVRHIQRFELGTRYPAIVAEAGQLLESRHLSGCCVLRFDSTGVGQGVSDMFRDAYRHGRLGEWWPEPVTITSGRTSSGLNVAKVDLVGALQRVLQERRLHVPEDVAGAAKLRQELSDFTAKISAAGRDQFEAATEAAHDDHVIAVALAVWKPTRAGRPRMVSPEGHIVDDAAPGFLDP